MSTVQVNQINNLNGNTPITVENLYQYVSYIEDIRSGDTTRIARGLNGLGMKSSAVTSPAVPNGLATLDSTGRLVGSQLPDTNIGRPGDLLFAQTKPTNGTWVKADGSIYSKNSDPVAAANIGPYMDFRVAPTVSANNPNVYDKIQTDGSITGFSYPNINSVINLVIYRSTDNGATFTSYNTGLTYSYQPTTVTMAFGNGIWVLSVYWYTGSSYACQVYSSTNLTSWTARSVPNGHQYQPTYAGFINGLFYLIPVAYVSNSYYYTSIDGINWNTTYDANFRTGNYANNQSNVDVINGIILVIGNGTNVLKFSIDGKNWQSSTLPAGIVPAGTGYQGQSYQWNYINGLYYLTMGGIVYTTPDLINYTLRPITNLATGEVYTIGSIFYLFNKYYIAPANYYRQNPNNANPQVVNSSQIIYSEDGIDWKLYTDAPSNVSFSKTTSILANGTRIFYPFQYLNIRYDTTNQFQVPPKRITEYGYQPWVKLA